MGYVIKNITKSDATLDNGVIIKPGEQLSVAQPTHIMQQLQTAGVLQIKSDEPTAEERKSDVAAVNEFVDKTK